MGIIRKKHDNISIRVFNGSQTYLNILKEKILVVNITDDPFLFVQSAFSQININEMDVIELNGVIIPILKKAYAWMVFKCVDIKITNSALVSNLIPIKSNINRLYIKAPNRGYNAVIEATVHATRYKITKEDKYLDLIKMYEKLVIKCGGQREKEALSLLKTFL